MSTLNDTGAPFHLCQCYLCQQVPLPLVVPILVLVWVQSTWMKLVALDMRPNLLTALEALPFTVGEVTERMLEYDVKVWRNGIATSVEFE